MSRLNLSISSIAALLGLSLASCTPLQDIDAGTCGNGVVEPEAGEECDTFPEDTCVPAGQENACRFECTPAGTNLPQGEDAKACPEGFGCGGDGLCRRASGNYAPTGPIRREQTIRVLSGDFDGDSVADLMSVTTSDVTVHYFDENGSVSDSTSVSAFPTLPAIGQLSNDQLADVVLVNPLQDSLAVLRGRSDGSLQPVAYAPFTVPTNSAEIVVMEALPSAFFEGLPTALGDEMMLLLDDGVYAPADIDDKVVGLPDTLANLASRPIVADFNLNVLSSPCQELALAYRGASTLWLFQPCAVSGGNFSWNWDAQESLPPVRLPGNARISSGARTADLNLDGKMDFIIAAEFTRDFCDDFNPADIYVAYGVGDGTFHSDPTSIPLANGDGLARFVNNDAVCSLPLAFAEMNGDGVIDFVSESGIFLSTAAGGGLPIPELNGAFTLVAFSLNGWNEAIIGDFNANGLLDVAAAPDGESKIELYSGTGTGTFNFFEISTNGEPAELTAGDYDGDLITDIAFRELGPHGNSSPGIENGDSLAVAFGTQSGAPSAAVDMGRLDRIQRIVAGNVATSGTVLLDDIRDVVVLSQAENDDTLSVALLGGTSTRQLTAPFSFDSEDTPDTQPVRAVIGEFDNDEAKHPDLAVLGRSSTEDVFGGRQGDNTLWLTPSSGEANLSQTTVGDSDLPDFLDIDATVMVPIDLDQDGVDELVLFGPNFVDIGGRVTVGRVTDDGDSQEFELVETSDTSELYEFTDVGVFYSEDEPIAVGNPAGDPPDGPGPDPNEGMSVDPGMSTLGTDEGGEEFDDGGFLEFGLYNTHFEVDDLNGDGLRDIIVLALDSDDFTVELVVYLNQGTGTLDFDNRIRMPLDEPVTGFTLIQANDDTAKELILLTADAAFSAALDLENKEVVFWRELQNLRGGFNAVSGDFNGDGVEDFAVAGEDGTNLYLGKAVVQ